MDGPFPTLCVITPCYNEAEGVRLFYETLKPALSALPGLDHRILFVDDGSEDATLEELNALAVRDPCVQVYSLSRNFGHQIALTAGLDAARDDAVVMMDSDLQHPPALLPEMVRLWRAGHDVVWALRQNTTGSPWFKRISSEAFYRLLRKLAGTPIVAGAADFCLLSRRAHQALLQLPERHRFLRGMVAWIGFKRVFVPFVAPPRRAGQSKYTWPKMLKLAVDATFSFSTVPLRLAAQVGLAAIGLSLMYLVFILVCLLLRQPLVPGWTSIIFLVTFFGGVQLACIGLLGEYVARIFEEAKRRPLYLLKQQPPSTAPDRNESAPDGNESSRAHGMPLL